MSAYETPRDVIFELLYSRGGELIPWNRASFCKAYGQLLYTIAEKIGLDIDKQFTIECICPWADPHTNPGADS